MRKIPNPMFEHPLEERCHQFGKRIRLFCRKLKIDVANFEDVKQLARASGSVGANYIEANKNVGSGDLKYRVKVCRKEAKESMHFLGLVELFKDKQLEVERLEVVDEANQLRKIFSGMLTKIIENSKDDPKK
jgi:four helix bundle protein